MPTPVTPVLTRCTTSVRTTVRCGRRLSTVRTPAVASGADWVAPRVAAWAAAWAAAWVAASSLAACCSAWSRDIAPAAYPVPVIAPNATAPVTVAVTALYRSRRAGVWCLVM